jgi:acetylornithine deacetylase/succinyl-diaminopimelate desuccinylase-like protein
MRRWRLPLAILVIGGIGVGALLVYNHVTEEEVESQLWIPKPTVITPEITRLQEYVRIDTSKANEIEGARYLAAHLAKAGVRYEIIEPSPGRASLYARIEGKRDGDALLLLNHIDVVPAPAAGWWAAPFSASARNNMILGRGTLDMKGIAICQLEAFLAVARSGRTPERDIVFLATADEEKDGAWGVGWLVEHRPDVFAGVRFALNEGGITETLQEKISYFGIEIGTKMVCRLRLVAPTREALQRTRIALEPNVSPPDPHRILPEVKEFLHDIAPLRLERRAELDDIDRTVAAGKFWLLPPGYRELTQNVIWLGGVQPEGGQFAMSVILYNLPDELPERRIEQLRREVAPFGVRVEVLRTAGPAPLTSRHTPMWSLLAREIRREYGAGFPIGSEILTVSYNDSRFLRARGIDAYGVWPFPVDYYQTDGIHGINERIRADWFMQGVSLTKRVVGAYAFEPLPAPNEPVTRSVRKPAQKPSELGSREAAPNT